MTYLIISISVIIIVFIYALGNTKIKKLEEKLYYEKRKYYNLSRKLKNRINLQ